MKYTPEFITSLKSNEVIVVGTNYLGAHGAGLALYATKHFGLKHGFAQGLDGAVYSLPTKGWNIETLPLSEIKQNIQRFVDCAKSNNHLIFYMTKIGCGLANLTPNDIAPLFPKSLSINVILPIEFAKIREELVDSKEKYSQMSDDDKDGFYPEYE